MAWTLGAILRGRSRITGVSDLLYFGPIQRVVILTCVEWQAGYTDRFGVTFIDFESKEKTRYPKRSATVLKEMFQKLISEK